MCLDTRYQVCVTKGCCTFKCNTFLSGWNTDFIPTLPLRTQNRCVSWKGIALISKISFLSGWNTCTTAQIMQNPESCVCRGKISPLDIFLPGRNTNPSSTRGPHKLKSCGTSGSGVSRGKISPLGYLSAWLKHQTHFQPHGSHIYSCS
jgi:hypothetical protein